MLSKTERAIIANRALVKLGARRATEAKRPATQGQVYPNPTGFDGVDPIGRKYRARICFADALTGKFCRITLGTFDSAESAGYAYCVAHIRAWGSASRYTLERFDP
jgi:hypothetical protein